MTYSQRVESPLFGAGVLSVDSAWPRVVVWLLSGGIVAGCSWVPVGGESIFTTRDGGTTNTPVHLAVDDSGWLRGTVFGCPGDYALTVAVFSDVEDSYAAISHRVEEELVAFVVVDFDVSPASLAAVVLTDDLPIQDGFESYREVPANLSQVGTMVVGRDFLDGSIDLASVASLPPGERTYFPFDDPGAEFVEQSRDAYLDRAERFCGLSD